ncbi:NAD P-binding protein [Gloeophyllum trabeum ATCC 11539]|uniref:NAD P-binding protein n=1 Tax=Gloeophyllum trabeum (strain ATCC 11539 / FP-39264 / Madison 617) TaxID=670483 RepID=S7RTP4_GLOTA|nr:NAD P-binding protein [Gloeophyllum trabeum ATCC 11539]EPQ56499.1 NAD P-binding protein [Gloeophyllum trabeum ATCC 11539]
MGAYLSMLTQQMWPAKSKFKVEDIPDLTGKVMIVTGANTGIGKETAKALLQHNAKVYIAARNQEKSEQAIKDLEQQTGKTALFLKLDLADLHSVKAAAEEFKSKESQLHVLFNNAGVMICPIDQVTAQGYDMQFGTNVLGHFYFTKLLLPTLLETAKTAPEGKVRVITTSSSAHLFFGLDFATFKDGPKRRKIDPGRLYAQSKFGNVVFANELARRYGDQGIISVSLNPGNIKSDLQRYTTGLQRRIINSILYPTPYGALTQLWAGTSAEGLTLNGKYAIPWARVGPARKDTADPELGKELWTWLEEQVKDI